MQYSVVIAQKRMLILVRPLLFEVADADVGTG